MNLLSVLAVLQMAIDGILLLLCPLGGGCRPQACIPLLIMLRIQVMQAQAIGMGYHSGSSLAFTKKWSTCEDLCADVLGQHSY